MTQIQTLTTEQLIQKAIHAGKCYFKAQAEYKHPNNPHLKTLKEEYKIAVESIPSKERNDNKERILNSIRGN